MKLNEPPSSNKEITAHNVDIQTIDIMVHHIFISFVNLQLIFQRETLCSLQHVYADALLKCLKMLHMNLNNMSKKEIK